MGFDLDNSRIEKELSVQINTNLQLILDKYKYDHLSFKDTYYHQNTNQIVSDNFDTLVDHSTSSNDLKKLLLINELNESNNYDNNGKVVNCNEEQNTVWDTYIDGHPFSNLYLKTNFYFDSNWLMNSESFSVETQQKVKNLEDPEI